LMLYCDLTLFSTALQNGSGDRPAGAFIECRAKKECPTMKIAPADRPNIIFIVADDLGYADLGC
jgi:hypothetical protein